MACALVSTSGSLLEVRWGSEIDAHQVVFRIGQGPVAGRYTTHVGSRNTSDRAPQFGSRYLRSLRCSPHRADSSRGPAAERCCT
mmetsp:Transcript_35568/g.113264  ORF Transcript_35568/g.113264 Transcript_35568/m.113264 type:complete len:84 (-) Transcript_35568:866-1117(-)